MILLDYRDKRPIYEQVVEKLERLIVNGALEADSKMPSVRSMGVDLAVNPNTVQRAYNQLEQEGYLYTVSGRGSFVAPESEWRDGKKKKMLSEWNLVTQRARESGLSREELEEELFRIYGDGESKPKPENDWGGAET
ncbi:MAG: GntR family transcriptional regulator [bacterium]|nr:GntR family transcriptional regulator [bacterium]